MNIDEEILLANILGVDRSYLLIHKNPILSLQQKEQFESGCAQLKNNMPLPYILGYKEFYKQRFIVTSNTLIPRPESECMIDYAKKLTSPQTTIFDIGTGSGCLAITMFKQTGLSTHATDISTQTIAIAQKNAFNHNAHITFHHGNLAEPVLSNIKQSAHTLILANLPYIPTNEYLNLTPDVLQEPRNALDGGNNGLYYYKQLFIQLQSINHPNLDLLCEIMPTQKQLFYTKVEKIIPHAQLKTIHDLANLPRFIHISLSS